LKLKKFIWITLGISVFICGLSLLAGYYFFGSQPEEKGWVSRASSNGPIVSEGESSGEDSPGEFALPPTPEPVRIHPNTKIIYEYFYQGDNTIDTSTESPPYFLMDMTREKLQKQYDGWQIIEFTDRQVVLRKNIPGVSAHSYILGVKDNFIAVYDQSQAGVILLKEVTNTPIQSLSDEEQEKLRSGIKVVGETQLAKILEDYGS
jgi:hypothetical protein